MLFDEDIKIAGDKPSKSVNADTNADVLNVSAADIAKAKEIGKSVALQFLNDTNITDNENLHDPQMVLQRRLLLSFTATVGFENFICDDSLSGIAQKSFLDTIRLSSEDLYRSSSDTGAFSFYYLAYRRGDDTERRIGQTFAMLCSHDGDPVYQELGEALYCWFLSVVRKAVSANEM